jgi:alkylhydroperoxidase/carboxymuconolactone decarboxylase family protein YurZ
MSDALNYLVKARPEAMTHYFAFLKDAGKHLDPKTRDLISVITKVHAQTERGFRQYLGRALRDGCTPMEVLDALLMAFPALGLAKIVWAVDIILAMDLPEFKPEAMSSKGQWTAIAAACSSIATRRTSASTTAAVRTRAPTSRTWHSTASRSPARSTSGPST